MDLTKLTIEELKAKALDELDKVAAAQKEYNSLREAIGARLALQPAIPSK